MERSTSEKGSVPPKRGTPKGNKNAKGASGNPSPKKPVKHGGYTPVFMDALDEDEQELVATVPEDTELQLMEQIQLFSIRERRILKAINKYREQNGDVSVADVTRFEDKRAFKDKEQELSTVQGKKTKAIETLSKLRLEKAKIENENAGNDTVDDWIEVILGDNA